MAREAAHCFIVLCNGFVLSVLSKLWWSSLRGTMGSGVTWAVTSTIGQVPIKCVRTWCLIVVVDDDDGGVLVPMLVGVVVVVVAIVVVVVCGMHTMN